MAVPLLQLTHVTKSFGAVQALQGVSFELRPGEAHALLGENGAGKSTLIKVITGAHRPDQGEMTVDGHRVAHLNPAAAHRLGIACIYQQPALFPDLTVAENIGLRLEAVRPLALVDWGARRRIARDLLQRIGANLPPEAEVRSLSMPEQQLVEIACAVGAGARIVLMDEPTASLTAAEANLLFGVVRGLRERGAGVLYISHRLEEIFALADRVTVLRDGRSVGTRRVRVSPGANPDAAADAAPPVTEGELIRLMVGRDVPATRPAGPEREQGEVVLSLRGLGSGSAGVQGISFDVRAGEIVGLAGLVGAGRTELARVLFGLLPADAGEIRLQDQPVIIRSPREAISLGIAYVPEDRRRHGILLEMAVAENISLASHDRLFPGGWLRFGAEEALARDFVGRLDVRGPGVDAPGAALSGGNQQKVALARWLATRPRVLILDEPTQGVDVGAKGEIHRRIQQLAAEGLAVLLISSDLPEVIALSDRIVVLRGGTQVAVLPGGAEPHTVMAAALGQELSSP